MVEDDDNERVTVNDDDDDDDDGESVSLEKGEEEEVASGEKLADSEWGSKPAAQQAGTMQSSRDLKDRRSPTSLLLQSTAVADVIIWTPIGPLSLPKSIIVLILNQNVKWESK